MNLTLTKSIKICFKKYATFEGKATRLEYWSFVLFAFVGSMGFMFFDRYIFTSQSISWGSGPMQLAWGLSIFIPLISVGSRRLHDTNRTGWWQLLVLSVYAYNLFFTFIIPLIFCSFLIVLFALPSKTHSSKLK